MGPNRSLHFKLRDFDNYSFEDMPKGELFRFGVNPYNGTVVITFQDRHENACQIIESVLNRP